MYCPNCGKEVEEDARFCGYCGYELVKEKEVSKVRPWVRFFARYTDYMIGGIILAIILGIVAPDSIFLAPNRASEILFTMLIMFIWIFVEAVLLSTWGTTPGKWLLKTTVSSQTGEKLTFSSALNRSFSVWLKGFGMGIPLVSLITLSLAYDKLTHNGITTWDAKGGLMVSHEKIGALRVILTVLLWIGFVFLIVLGTMAEKSGW